jgi:hypothetical protein
MITAEGEWVEPAKGMFWATIRKRSLLKRIKILNHQDLEDILQEILIYIWNKRLSYDETKPVNPWLMTLIRRQISNRIRDRVARAKKSILSFSNSADVSVVSALDSWDEFLPLLSDIELGVLNNPRHYANNTLYPTRKKIRIKYKKWLNLR